MYSTTTDPTAQSSPKTKLCEGCNEPFVLSRYVGKRQRYCSETCRNKYRERFSIYHYVCEHCTKPYSTEHKERNRFCSRQCTFAHKAANKKPPKPPKPKKTIHCKQCGGTFQQQKREEYCSDDCRIEMRRSKDVERHMANFEEKELVCKECGGTFTLEYGAGGTRRIYCGVRCAKRASKRESGGTLNHRARRILRRRHGRITSDIYVPIRPGDIYLRDNWLCGICGRPIDKDADHWTYYSPSIDHVVPLSRGGTHTPNNVQAAHFGCNSRKGAT